MKLILNPEFSLYEKGGKPFCDSLQIAETFERPHDDILKSIEGETRKGAHKNGLIDELNGLAESRVMTRDYFIKSSYKDGRNRSQKKYLMSRDGFTLLTMGFEGEKALRFKLSYIRRFNQMEAFISSLLEAKMEFPAFTDAVMLAHEEPKHYHYSNEINMIYRIVLGMDAKKFREANGIPAGEGIRPYLSEQDIKMVRSLQHIDVGLLEVVKIASLIARDIIPVTGC